MGSEMCIRDRGYYGTFAANSMRLEKGYRAWGMDLTTERTPIEAGLKRFVLSEDREFTGKTTMLERQQSSNWCMVLLELESINQDPVDPFYAHAVLCDERVIGVVTSGAYGHRTAKTLALAYLNDAIVTGQLLINQPLNGRLHVNILGKSREAKIQEQIPYDPGNQMMKTNTKLNTKTELTNE